MNELKQVNKLFSFKRVAEWVGKAYRKSTIRITKIACYNHRSTIGFVFPKPAVINEMLASGVLHYLTGV